MSAADSTNLTRTADDAERVLNRVAIAREELRLASYTASLFARDIKLVVLVTDELGQLNLTPQDTNTLAVGVFECQHEGDAWVVWYEADGKQWYGAPDNQIWRIDAVSGVSMGRGARQLELTPLPTE